MGEKIDFSDFRFEPWMPLLHLVKREIDKRVADGVYVDGEETGYSLRDDLEMVECDSVGRVSAGRERSASVRAGPQRARRRTGFRLSKC